ncbi:MAG TPA: malto-oligosyltrehalose synthase [Steroidobacteraceae bacterium]
MRLQFHRGFGFADAVPLVSYFAALGISHLYASPIMTARPGSMHGYDAVDPTRINPELGGEEEFRRLVAELRRHEMGIIIDIVPNHMAIGSDNPWWTDVLAGGRTSRYAKFFDIDWEPVSLHLRGKVLLPVLGRPYGEALAAGELRLHCDADEASIRYFDHKFPLADADAHVVRRGSLDAFDPTSANGRQRLHELLEEQYYRLAWWRSANDEINWRRFFDINELAALRVEVDEVFEAVHAKVFSLYAEGLIDGVRVDHVDGLAQPGDYCRKLRTRLRELEVKRPSGAPKGPAFFVVEKILSRAEELRQAWATDGTTGYDFMDEVSALQHDPSNEQTFTELWEHVSGRPGAFDTEEELARRQVLNRSFSAQLESTVRSVYVIAQSELTTRDISWSAIRRCLTEILSHFPVYRIYARVEQAAPADLKFLSGAVECAKKTSLAVDVWLIEKLGAWLAGQRMRLGNDPLQNIALARFQQLSAPLCAKAVEDTAFYRYGRLISRNDVGFDVRKFSASPSEFHLRLQARAAAFPHTMLATATHDHKRGEDVRARLAVLSELAAEWKDTLVHWLEVSIPHCETIDGGLAPTMGDRAILFQTIVGAWPMSLTDTDEAGLTRFAARIAAWQLKALREAKLHTDWSAPNEAYESASARFVARLFGSAPGLLKEVGDFARRLAPVGAVNGLAQTLIKVTAPGVCDIYQGTEYWDLSLVDPDNRAAVDFAARKASLEGGTLDELAESWVDGRLKQFVIARILEVRKNVPEIFAEGDYVPLEIIGPMSKHLVAFARVYGGLSTITVVSRVIGRLLHNGNGLKVVPSLWSDTVIKIPDDVLGRFSDVLVPERGLSIGPTVTPGELFTALPIAFLASLRR